jgi:hypothetical protein
MSNSLTIIVVLMILFVLAWHDQPAPRVTGKSTNHQESPPVDGGKPCL